MTKLKTEPILSKNLPHKSHYTELVVIFHHLRGWGGSHAANSSHILFGAFSLICLIYMSSTTRKQVIGIIYHPVFTVCMDLLSLSQSIKS